MLSLQQSSLVPVASILDLIQVQEILYCQAMPVMQVGRLTQVHQFVNMINLDLLKLFMLLCFVLNRRMETMTLLTMALHFFKKVSHEKGF